MGISIHALREEGDGRLRYFGHQAEIISIHALREEGDDKHALVVKLLKIFLSTPSARRATIGRYSDRLKRLISIHALREEGDQRRRFPRGVVGISIHALREEGDKHTKRTAGSVWHFYPRPPRGGRLGQHTEGGGRFLLLSTPSARRATLPAAAIRSVIDDFYPRPPRVGRRSNPRW